MHIAGLPRASVALHVNGAALQEYGAESEHPMTATSYVETVHGAEFSVMLKLERNFTPRGSFLRHDERLICAISLDGQAVTSHLLTAQHLKTGLTYGMDNARDNVDGVACYRKFTFAQHKTSKYIARLNQRGDS